jgi:hypothetical protein
MLFLFLTDDLSLLLLMMMMSSNIYYINDRYDKRTWTYIFGACCATTVFIPSFHNYRIWSFLGLVMTTYTAWYLTVAAVVHGQVSIIFVFLSAEQVVLLKGSVRGDNHAHDATMGVNKQIMCL